MKFIIVPIFSIFILSAHAYDKSKLDNKYDLYWGDLSTIPLYVKSNVDTGTSIRDITKENSDSITQDMINLWNEISPIKLHPIFVNDGFSFPNDRVGSLSYSSDPRYFGPGVLGITRIEYSGDHGVISKADIILNSNADLFNYQSSRNQSMSGASNIYLGNVISHELGHFLGLGHNELNLSTMIYAVSNGQYRVSKDEELALNENHLPDRFFGRVLDSFENPIYGANVVAISQKYGRAITNRFTDINGEFKFKGLDKDDSYTFMIFPMKNKESLTNSYEKITDSYCPQMFYPSLFSKCGSRGRGKGQFFNLKNHNLENYNLGNLKINCSLSFNNAYQKNKATDGEAEIDLLEPNSISPTSSILGYFKNNEIGVALASDNFKLDLSWYTPEFGDSLRIDLLSESLFSNVRYELKIKNIETSQEHVFYPQNDIEHGKVQLDIRGEVLLSMIQNQNNYIISIKPIAKESNHFGSSSLISKENLYFIMTSIISTNDNSYVALNDTYPYEDNNSCLEGSALYTLTQEKTIFPQSNSKSSENYLSCGTVGSDSGNNSGGGISMIFGALFFLLLIKLREISTKILS